MDGGKKFGYSGIRILRPPKYCGSYSYYLAVAARSNANSLPDLKNRSKKVIG